METVSGLLKVIGSTHCVSHAPHLILTTDSMAHIPTIMTSLRKCKQIVNVLHLKAELLDSEVSTSDDAIACNALLDKIHDVSNVLDANDQFAI